MSDPKESAYFKCQTKNNADFKERDEVAVNQNFKFYTNQLYSRKSDFESNSFNALAEVEIMDTGLLEDSREIETVVTKEMDIQNSKHQNLADILDTDAVLNSKDFLINPKVVETPVFSHMNLVITQNMEAEIKVDQISALSTIKATESTQSADVLGAHKPDFECKNFGIQEEVVTNYVIEPPSTTLAAGSKVIGNPSSCIIPGFISRDNSPHSAVILNFKKTSLKKDKKNESSGSKHLLFKEL
ncbi:hypothetical protein MA16_Dca001108 [Dendrobium catenatum]|uniref:Uncharacterized protein n=1 Tax=Dendrobium catenatum TaxID=906689 RepID=A0A2I0WLG3_9ASPA|nr:hypothetical protein MA16_Dca001108 [Dendrobium catenatum]